MDDIENSRIPLLYHVKLCASFQSHQWIETWVTVRKRSYSSQNLRFFVPCDLEIWRMTLENIRAPLPCCFKLCASFHSHQWIQTGVTVRKRPIWVNIDEFLSRATFEFDRWLWKKIGHPFYATLSFVHHFVAIGEFKLESQFGKSHFRSCEALTNNRASPQSNVKLCAPFHSHMWI